MATKIKSKSLDNEGMDGDILAYFQMTDNLIQFIKERQVKILNYAVLLQAALIYLYTKIFYRTILIYTEIKSNTAFIIFSIIIMIYMLMYLERTQSDLKKYRKRQTNIINRFASNNLKNIINPNDDHNNCDLIYILAYIAVIVFSCIFSIIAFHLYSS